MGKTKRWSQKTSGSYLLLLIYRITLQLSSEHHNYKQSCRDVGCGCFTSAFNYRRWDEFIHGLWKPWPRWCCLFSVVTVNITVIFRSPDEELHEAFHLFEVNAGCETTLFLGEVEISPSLDQRVFSRNELSPEVSSQKKWTCHLKPVKIITKWF